ncbi:MAG: hypothetical protein KDD67_13855 [Ignavibacteriae bacterium]|nr:hypothetical protein [Ignavibacteriota bacterium]MCB9216128.1 hypothetical protein [Ignavibacteria bacterium]
MLSLSQLETRVRELVNAWARNRLSPEEMLANLDQVFIELGIAGPGRPAVVEQIYLGAQEQFSWLTSRIVEPLVQRGLAETLRAVGNGFARMGGRIREDVSRLVSLSITQELSRNDIANRLESTLSLARHHATTVAQTGVAAFDRIGNLSQALESGMREARYVGPIAERIFCEKLMAQSKRGKWWTIEEILAMDNGQGTTPLYDCGGHWCRHGWEFRYGRR